ncbi:hypothetical protein FDP41_010074 [Naegleria fowleri]|uniref:Uncharacterized protein n=1 Tax=Naegleria fowleri TaxID=5763 RepID=A0A6A5BAA6_NAEFO|nr:uncharacterized protein FDP41_010074 [Naegleria fowleri]KAF0971851.1 hypothetical protein FDP41_010074 [Naegleria fowleri]CAG4708562.1 unnamed protein product [Naegleria fowleri]
MDQQVTLNPQNLMTDKKGEPETAPKITACQNLKPVKLVAGKDFLQPQPLTYFDPPRVKQIRGTNIECIYYQIMHNGPIPRYQYPIDITRAIQNRSVIDCDVTDVYETDEVSDPKVLPDQSNPQNTLLWFTMSDGSNRKGGACIILFVI